MAKTKNIICMQTTIKFLRVYGIFPKEGEEFNPGRSFYAKFALQEFIRSIVLVGSFLHFIQSMRVGIYTSLDSDLVCIFSLGSTFMSTVGFVFKSKPLTELFLYFSNFEEFGEPPEFVKDNKFYNKLSFCHYIYLECLIYSQLVFSTIYNTSSCKKFNELYSLEEICGLYTYTWMPFNIDFSPVKQIFLVVQAFGAHHSFMFAGLCSWCVLETVQHIRIRLRHINHLFQEAVREVDPKIRKEKFNHAVRYHSSVLSFEDKMNGVFGFFMFTHMAITAPIIGTGIYSFLLGDSISSLMIAGGWIIGLGWDCLGGQWLQDECLAIGVDLYLADWFHCDDDLKKDIMMVIRRSWTPMLLRASSFGVMDYRMFLAVMKGSYSYITLLTQT